MSPIIVLPLLLAQTPNSLDKPMPAIDRRNLETIELYVAGVAVVYRRHVGEGKLHILGDLVSQRVPDGWMGCMSTASMDQLDFGGSVHRPPRS